MRRHQGDPPGLYYSMCDEAVCPIYFTDEEHRQFLFDVKTERGDHDESSALGIARCRACWVAMALNSAYDNSAGHRAAFAGFFAETETP